MMSLLAVGLMPCSIRSATYCSCVSMLLCGDCAYICDSLLCRFI